MGYNLFNWYLFQFTYVRYAIEKMVSVRPAIFWSNFSKLLYKNKQLTSAKLWSRSLHSGTTNNQQPAQAVAMYVEKIRKTYMTVLELVVICITILYKKLYRKCKLKLFNIYHLSLIGNSMARLKGILNGEPYLQRWHQVKLL